MRARSLIGWGATEAAGGSLAPRDGAPALYRPPQLAAQERTRPLHTTSLQPPGAARTRPPTAALRKSKRSSIERNELSALPPRQFGHAPKATASGPPELPGRFGLH